MKKIKHVFSICTILTALFFILFSISVEATEQKKLSKSTITLDVNGTYTLKVTGVKGTVTWSTSNKKIATVNKKGKVTAIASGNATITAKVKGKKYTCKVTVRKAKLNTSTLSLDVNGTYTLKTSGIKGSVKWSTSNKKIATVTNKGKVIGKNTGTATITAKIGKYTYKCKVTVRKPVLNKTSISLYEGKTYPLKVTGIAGKITWSSSNTKIAKISSTGKVTAIKHGTASISAKAGNTTLVCKVTVLPKEKPAPVHSHTWKIEKREEPTCTNDGYISYSCTCGEIKKEILPSLGHLPGEFVIEKEATKTTTGLKVKRCKRCNEILETIEIPKLHEHHYVNKVTSKPTCTKVGEESEVCEICGHIRSTTSIPKVNHDFSVLLEHKDPSCEEKGYDMYACRYGCISKRTQYISSLDHDLVKEPSTSTATCTKDGHATYHCKRNGCSYKTQLIDKAHGHDYKEFSREEATCTENGKITYKCSFCDDKYDVPIAATGHKYGDWVVTKEPASYTEFGERKKACINCGEEETQLVIWVDYGNPDGEKHLVYGNFNFEYAKELFDLTNELRVANGYEPLLWRSELDQYTLIRAAEAASQEYWDLCHNRPNGINDAPGGENITYYCSDTDSATHALKSFENSKPHLETIFDKRWNTGNFACLKWYDEKERPYYTWIQIFYNDLSLRPHIHYYEPQHIVEIKPTCTTDGSITKTCGTCGEVTVEVIPNKGGHNFVKKDDECILATENSFGKEVQYCNTCNLRKDILLPKLGQEESSVPNGYFDYEIRQELFNEINKNRFPIFIDKGSSIITENNILDNISLSNGYSSIEEMKVAFYNSDIYKKITHPLNTNYNLILSIYVQLNVNGIKKYYFAAIQP